jgi:hypothetical protein
MAGSSPPALTSRCSQSNCGDVSTRDNKLDDNNDDDIGNGSREFLRAINVGMGSMLCPPAPTMDGLRTRV